MTLAAPRESPALKPAAGWPHRRPLGWLGVSAVLVACLMALPILSVATNTLLPGTPGTWPHLASTVLPGYIVTTIWLCLGVGSLAALIGVGSAWLVTHFEFPLRRSLEWALVLPLAMPAYVMAYAYTDALQFAGPVQGWLRVRDMLCRLLGMPAPPPGLDPSPAPDRRQPRGSWLSRTGYLWLWLWPRFR